MMNLFQKKKVICSPMNGEIIELEKVPDEVFKSKMMGDGFAVVPTDGRVVSPVDGEIIKVFKTKHAVLILSDTGLELIVHIGLDTVELAGNGFTVHVENGQRVRVGDLLLEVDLNYIVKQGKSLVSPVVVSNMEGVKSVQITKGIAKEKDQVCLVK